VKHERNKNRFNLSVTLYLGSGFALLSG